MEQITTQLIYRTSETIGENISPFDKAICELMATNDVLIACPYIGLDYFQKIITHCTSWKLLTDINAWIESYKPTPNQLPRILQFIRSNRKDIRHFKDLHAKVLVSNNKAFLGSANLTKKGIEEREEMAVIINDAAQVQEINVWFRNLWTRTYELGDIEEKAISEYIVEFLKWEKQNSNKPKINLRLRKPKKLQFSTKPDIDLGVTVTQELPSDIPLIHFEGKQLLSVRSLADRIIKEDSILFASARIWIRQMVTKGKVQGYQYRNILLLDEEGATEIWTGRLRIREGTHNLSGQGKYKIIPITNNQLLTIDDIVSITKKSRNYIGDLIKSGKIQPKLRAKSYIFDRSIIEQINNIPLEETGYPRKQPQNSNPSVIDPLSNLQRFLLQNWKEGMTDNQILDMAKQADVSKSVNRQTVNQSLQNARAKQILAKQYNIDIFTLEKRRYLVKSKAGRPRKKK